jgi:exosortase
VNQFAIDRPADQTKSWSILGGLLLVILYCYFNSLQDLWHVWMTSPMYHHGYLIPAIGVFLLWYRRQELTDPESRDVWIGVGLILVATALRIFAAYRVNFSLDRVTLLIAIGGAFVLIGGLTCLRWAGPPILFLFFMFPWPRPFVDGIMRPMQTLATMISAYALQTLGIDALRDGNRILLENVPLNVAEQCSGLRMLTIFIAISLALAMISTHRPMWERVVIVLSSPVIALLVNAIRISITGLLLSFEVGEDAFHRMIHDGAGLVMMPIAIGFLFLEMQILQRIIIEDETSNVAPGFGQSIG